MTDSTPSPAALPTLIFIRHGATAPNLAGLRCGGDLDLRMTETGRAQIAQAAQTLRERGWCIDLIVASDLQRTRESAEIVAAALGGVPVQIDAAWRERSLGQWNMKPVADTEAALRAGQTPPGGESNVAFSARIGTALKQFVSTTRSCTPLLIGSRGVARVLCETLHAPKRAPVGNGEILCFGLASLESDCGHANASRNPAPREAALHADLARTASC